MSLIYIKYYTGIVLYNQILIIKSKQLINKVGIKSKKISR